MFISSAAPVNITFSEIALVLKRFPTSRPTVGHGKTVMVSGVVRHYESSFVFLQSNIALVYVNGSPTYSCIYRVFLHVCMFVSLRRNFFHTAW